MKIDRLIGILSILLQKDKITAAELAEKFEVSRRTIIRDIETINQAGIPILTSQGKGGGISIQQSDQFNIDSHMIIDLSTWNKSAIFYKIDQIQTAIKNNEKISFTYFSPNGQIKRELEPYHLIFQRSSWYIWGYCTTRNDYRMFKLTRLTDLTCTGEHYEKRNIPAYFSNKFTYTRSEIKAIVKFSPSVKWRLIDECGAFLPEEDAEGNLFLTLTWPDLSSFFQYILTFGDQAEIISPKEYRQQFLAILKKIAEKYER